jgi:Gpi18-like mannosyltransferase
MEATVVSDYAFDGLADAMRTGAIALCIAVPLALWKLVDIIWWACHHIHVGFR